MEKSRRFLVDILTLVAVALEQIFGFQWGLEGFVFGPVLVDLLVICFAYLLRGFVFCMSDQLQIIVPTFDGTRSSYVNYEE